MGKTWESKEFPSLAAQEEKPTSQQLAIEMSTTIQYSRDAVACQVLHSLDNGSKLSTSYEFEVIPGDGILHNTKSARNSKVTGH